MIHLHFMITTHIHLLSLSCVLRSIDGLDCLIPTLTSVLAMTLTLDFGMAWLKTDMETGSWRLRWRSRAYLFLFCFYNFCFVFEGLAYGILVWRHRYDYILSAWYVVFIERRCWRAYS